MITNELYEKYSKIGGWLLLFAGLCVFNIGSQVVQMLNLKSDLAVLSELNLFSSNMLIFFSYLELFILIGIFAFLLFALYKRYSAKSLRLTLIVFAVVRIIAIVLSYFLLNAFLNEVAPGSMSEVMQSSEIAKLVGNVIGNLIFTAIWFTYFTKSIRVGVYTGAIEPPIEHDLLSHHE